MRFPKVGKSSSYLSMEQWRWYGDHPHGHLISHLSSKIDNTSTRAVRVVWCFLMSWCLLSMTSSKTHAIGLYPFRSTNALQRKLPHHIRTPSAFCEASQLYLQKVLQLIWSFFFRRTFVKACKNNLSHEKNPPTFHYTGCLIGILIIMVCYNPYITG